MRVVIMFELNLNLRSPYFDPEIPNKNEEKKQFSNLTLKYDRLTLKMTSGDIEMSLLNSPSSETPISISNSCL